jgi:hypothetical protein
MAARIAPRVHAASGAVATGGAVVGRAGLGRARRRLTSSAVS